MSRGLPSRKVHGSVETWRESGLLDFLVEESWPRGEGVRVYVSWLSGPNSTVPSLCAGRQCSGSRDRPCKRPGVTRRFDADEIGEVGGIWASVVGRPLKPWP